MVPKVCNLPNYQGSNNTIKGRMEYYNEWAPFERIAIAVAGPFPTIADNNQYILVAIDYFSKLPEAYVNQEASVVARWHEFLSII